MSQYTREVKVKRKPEKIFLRIIRGGLVPADNFAEVIVSACGYFTIHDGSDLKYWVSTNHVKWTEFTQEKWEFLNQ